MNDHQIFKAWYHCREAYEYMLRHSAGKDLGDKSNYYAERSEQNLRKAADALGFDLVKREAVKVEEAA